MRRPTLSLLLVILVAAGSAVAAPVGEGWQVQSMVVAGGGRVWNGDSASLGGTIGQSAVGIVSGGTSQISQGFWQAYASGSCCHLRADIDHDGAGPFITDLIYLVSYMFMDGAAPPCNEEADVDGNGEVVIIDDLIYLVQYMFQGGEAPVPCSLPGA